MINIYATAALLRNSKTSPQIHVCNHSPEQVLHSWYACNIEQALHRKHMVLYVHYASQLTIICNGTTISETIDEFKSHLEHLLIRFEFDPQFISSEISALNEWVVSKTLDLLMLHSVLCIREIVKNYADEVPPEDDWRSGFEEILAECFEHEPISCSSEAIVPLSFFASVRRNTCRD